MAEQKTVTFEYAGKTFEADAKAATSWKVIKGLNSGGPAMFDAFDELFQGRADEYADALGGDFRDMGELAGKAIEAAGAKNS